MLPKADGFTVAQRLRRAHVGTPILLLTARDAISDKICGYDSGADDYMTKPFSPAELLARLGALTPVSYTHLDVYKRQHHRYRRRKSHEHGHEHRCSEH